MSRPDQAPVCPEKPFEKRSLSGLPALGFRKGFFRSVCGDLMETGVAFRSRITRLIPLQKGILR